MAAAIMLTAILTHYQHYLMFNNTFFTDVSGCFLGKNDSFVTQHNYHYSFGTNVSFFSWWRVPELSGDPCVVAIWRIKELKK